MSQVFTSIPFRFLFAVKLCSYDDDYNNILIVFACPSQITIISVHFNMIRWNVGVRLLVNHISRQFPKLPHYIRVEETSSIYDRMRNRVCTYNKYSLFHAVTQLNVLTSRSVDRSYNNIVKDEDYRVFDIALIWICLWRHAA